MADIAVLVAILPPIIAAPIANGVAFVSTIFLPRPVRVVAVVPDLTRLAAAIIAVHFTLIVTVSDRDGLAASRDDPMGRPWPERSLLRRS